MMTIFCLEEFKTEFDRLKTKKQYRNLEAEIIDYFFGKSIHELKSGTCLNNSITTPYIKKRLSGSGGYRFYYLLLIKDDKLYLMFVHPKTGPFGAENIKDESKAHLYKRILDAITENDLYQLELSESKKEILFSKNNASPE